MTIQPLPTRQWRDGTRLHLVTHHGDRIFHFHGTVCGEVGDHLVKIIDDFDGQEKFININYCERVEVVGKQPPEIDHDKVGFQPEGAE